jgi:phenylalanyl-tRNA synthetase beta chain
LGSLKTPAPKPLAGAFDCPTRVHLDFSPADAHLCPAFALASRARRHQRPSPEWMQKRLRAIGLRPINALVDITNYITFDRGRPLHVFDAAKVEGDLTVRRARPGESVLALDGKTYTLEETWSSSPTPTASNRSPESWAASIPAATRRRATC